jgi:outer membrane lipoprotein-sorting protein
MKIKHIILFFIFTGMPVFSAMAQEISAKEIIKRADDLMQGQSNYADIQMIVHRPKWERSLSFKSWMKGSDYSLIYITEPVKEKGQVFLKREREMWNWLPSIDRMIKIPPSMMMQSWMGSDITNDDLVNESSIVDDYSHTLLKKEIFEGEECYKIQLIPHEDAPVVWGKIISWVSVKNLYTLKNEYYDEDDFLVNTETLSNIKTIGDRTIPTKYTIVPADEENQWTTMEFVNIKFNINIDDAFFSIQNMKKIR